LTSKKRKVKFGMFPSETKANEYIEHTKKHKFNNDDARFFVVKRETTKTGKNAFEAYALIPR
jgi:hypothetical protein